MTLRARLTVVVAVAVAGAVLVAVGVAWVATQHRLRAEIDDALTSRAVALADLPAMATLAQRTPPAGGVGRPGQAGGAPGIRAALIQDISIQVIGADGRVTALAGSDLPVRAVDRRVAAGDRRSLTRHARVDGDHFRVRTQAIEGGGAVQVGRDVTETDRTLRSLALLLGLTAVAGVVAAAVVGLVVARRALRPIDDLTRATERVARDQDLTAPLPTPSSHDEVGRLTESFNTMVAALATSRAQQQRLVTDASHELRTPLTSLRTTIELLRRADAAASVGTSTESALPPDQRRELYDHALDELAELTHLATELVDLATDARTGAGDLGPVDLAEVTETVATRARRRTGQTVTVTRADANRGTGPRTAGAPTVSGHRTAIERAVANLVDNAGKWSPPGAPIEITVSGGVGMARVAVRDHGPGVAEAERERVFERFARGADAQAVPGSGLGLAIVRQVATEHGGRAWIEAAPGGGAVAIVEFSGDSSAP